MTAPNLRVVRRRRAPLVASLTAAVAPVKDPSKLFTTGVAGRDQWQQEAWRFTRTVGELGFYVRWRSNACAQVRLVASEIDPETGFPTGSIAKDNKEGAKVVDIVRQIAGGPLGQKALIKRAAAQLTVPGELWVCILQRDNGEQWYAVGKKEITRSEKFVKLADGSQGQSVAIKLPDGTKHDYNPSQDAMFRVWNESFEDAQEADSPVRACLDSLAEIERATKKIRNADQSRLLNNGLLMVPSEASLPDTRGEDTTDPASPRNTRRVAASLQRMIIQAAETAIADENSLAAHVPIVAAAPGEHLGKIAHIEFSKEATKAAVEIRTDAISRLAMGLDMSPERLLGMGNNSNHWSAYLLADEDVKMHISPVMEVLCQAIYEASMTGLLEQAGLDPNKYTLWFDASKLTADPDLTDEARDAYSTGSITSKALVEKLGLPENALYDFTNAEGIALWARDRVSAKPELLSMLGQLIPELADKNWMPEPVDTYTDDTAAEPTTELPDEETQAPTKEPDTENADPTAPTYSAIEDVMVNRALEIAAKRRIGTRDRALYARLRNIPTHERNRHLPALTPDQAAKYTAGWDDTLTPTLAATTGVNLNRLRTAVNTRVQAELCTDHTNVHVVNGNRV